MRLFIILAVTVFTSFSSASSEDSCAKPLGDESALNTKVQQKFKKGFNLGVFRKWVKAMDPLEPQILRALPLDVRLDAIRQLWDKLHTYAYIRHTGSSFSLALGEWQINLLRLIELGNYGDAWTQLSLYPNFRYIQGRIDQAESSSALPQSGSHIDVGAIDLQKFIDVYADLAPQGQAILTGFALAYRPSEAEPLVDAWLRAFSVATPSGREELIYFKRWGAGDERMFHAIVNEWSNLTSGAQEKTKQHLLERGLSTLIPQKN